MPALQLPTSSVRGATAAPSLWASRPSSRPAGTPGVGDWQSAPAVGGGWGIGRLRRSFLSVGRRGASLWRGTTAVPTIATPGTPAAVAAAASGGVPARPHVPVPSDCSHPSILSASHDDEPDGGAAGDGDGGDGRGGGAALGELPPLTRKQLTQWVADSRVVAVRGFASATLLAPSAAVRLRWGGRVAAGASLGTALALFSSLRVGCLFSIMFLTSMVAGTGEPYLGPQLESAARMILGAVVGAVSYLAARSASTGDDAGVLLFVLAGPLLLLFAACRSDQKVAGVAIPAELTLGTLIISNMHRETAPALADIGWSTANIALAFVLAVVVNVVLAPDRAMDAGLTLLSASLVQIGAGVSTASSSLLHRPGVTERVGEGEGGDVWSSTGLAAADALGGLGAGGRGGNPDACASRGATTQAAQTSAGPLHGPVMGATSEAATKRYKLEDWSDLVTAESDGGGITKRSSRSGDVPVAVDTPPLPLPLPIDSVESNVVLSLPTAGKPDLDEDPPLPSRDPPPPPNPPERLAVPLGSAMRESLSALARAATLIDVGCQEPKLWRPHGGSVESKHAWRAVTDAVRALLTKVAALEAVAAAAATPVAAVGTTATTTPFSPSTLARFFGPDADVHGLWTDQFAGTAAGCSVLAAALSPASMRATNLRGWSSPAELGVGRAAARGTALYRLMLLRNRLFWRSVVAEGAAAGPTTAARAMDSDDAPVVPEAAFYPPSARPPSSCGPGRRPIAGGGRLQGLWQPSRHSAAPSAPSSAAESGIAVMTGGGGVGGPRLGAFRPACATPQRAVLAPLFSTLPPGSALPPVSALLPGSTLPPGSMLPPGSTLPPGSALIPGPASRDSYGGGSVGHNGVRFATTGGPGSVRSGLLAAGPPPETEVITEQDLRDSELRAILFAVTTSQEITEALADVMAAVDVLATSKRRTSLRPATQWTFFPVICLMRRLLTVGQRRLKRWEVTYMLQHTMLLWGLVGIALFSPLRGRWGADRLSWTFVAAALVSQPTSEATVYSGVVRVCATLAGCIVGYLLSLLSLLLGRSYDAVLVAAVGVTSFGLVVAIPLRYRDSAYLATSTNMVLTVCPLVGSACQSVTDASACRPDWDTALARALFTSTGVVLASVFHVVFLPRWRATEVRADLAAAFAGAGRAYSEMFAKFFAGVAEATEAAPVVRQAVGVAVEVRRRRQAWLRKERSGAGEGSLDGDAGVERAREGGSEELFGATANGGLPANGLKSSVGGAPAATSTAGAKPGSRAAAPRAAPPPAPKPGFRGHLDRLVAMAARTAARWRLVVARSWLWGLVTRSAAAVRSATARPRAAVAAGLVVIRNKKHKVVAMPTTAGGDARGGGDGGEPSATTASAAAAVGNGLAATWAAATAAVTRAEREVLSTKLEAKVGKHLARATVSWEEDAAWYALGPLHLPANTPSYLAALRTAHLALSEMAALVSRRPLLTGVYMASAHAATVEPFRFDFQTLTISLAAVGGLMDRALRATAGGAASWEAATGWWGVGEGAARRRLSPNSVRTLPPQLATYSRAVAAGETTAAAGAAERVGGQGGLLAWNASWGGGGGGAGLHFHSRVLSGIPESRTMEDLAAAAADGAASVSNVAVDTVPQGLEVSAMAAAAPNTPRNGRGRPGGTAPTAAAAPATSSKQHPATALSPTPQFSAAPALTAAARSLSRPIPPRLPLLSLGDAPLQSPPLTPLFAVGDAPRQPSAPVGWSPSTAAAPPPLPLGLPLLSLGDVRRPRRWASLDDLLGASDTDGDGNGNGDGGGGRGGGGGGGVGGVASPTPRGVLPRSISLDEGLGLGGRAERAADGDTDDEMDGVADESLLSDDAVLFNAFVYAAATALDALHAVVLLALGDLEAAVAAAGTLDAATDPVDPAELPV
ncbi:hypothetical protein MMPV_004585 [Pyropia vietnamensis]